MIEVLWGAVVLDDAPQVVLPALGIHRYAQGPFFVEQRRHVNRLICGIAGERSSQQTGKRVYSNIYIGLFI